MPHSREACILVLALLALALAGCVTAETPELTLPVITEEPGASPPPYPPPGQPTPYPPAPTRTPTATPWGIGNLPPLPTYPPPGPFSGMRIIYTKAKPSGYYTINADGTDEIMLPPWPQDQRNGQPSLTLRPSPAGNKLLYSLSNAMDPGIAAIWIMDHDGGSKELLVDSTGPFQVGNCFPEDAIWSPDGGAIAYRWHCLSEPVDDLGIPTSTRQLWVMNSDGSQKRLVLDDPALYAPVGGSVAQFFRWMRNGYIYFYSHDQNMYAINPNDGGLYKLMDDVDVFEIRASISPDGEHALVIPDIAASTLEQAGLTQVAVDFNYNPYAPYPSHIWSRDGSLLVYLQGESVRLRDVSTGEDRLLLPQHVYMLGMSPDNYLFAYQGSEGLYILDLTDIESQPYLVIPNYLLEFFMWVPIK